MNLKKTISIALNTTLIHEIIKGCFERCTMSEWDDEWNDDDDEFNEEEEESWEEEEDEW
jgi:hypothetical protein